MQGPALALGAAAMESLMLQWSENRGGLCNIHIRVEVHSAKSECPSAIAVGEQGLFCATGDSLSPIPLTRIAKKKAL